VEILEWLREAVHRKWPGLWSYDWIPRHDNAPANKALFFKQFLAQKNQLLKWNTQPIPLMWLRMISDCSQK
jgi:hypothetical protein